jgi:hypothetical protein
MRYRRDWHDTTLTGMGPTSRPVDPALSRTTVRSVLGRSGPHSFERGIKGASLEIFDRTFRVTEVLRVLANIVAFRSLKRCLRSSSTVPASSASCGR